MTKQHEGNLMTKQHEDKVKDDLMSEYICNLAVNSIWNKIISLNKYNQD